LKIDSRKKKKQNTGKTTKMISDREDKKNGRFLPLLKRRNKRKYRYCRSCKFNCRHCKTKQLDARAKILEDHKSD
jgi:hypothetical protein